MLCLHFNITFVLLSVRATYCSCFLSALSSVTCALCLQQMCLPAHLMDNFATFLHYLSLKKKILNLVFPCLFRWKMDRLYSTTTWVSMTSSSCWFAHRLNSQKTPPTRTLLVLLVVPLLPPTPSWKAVTLRLPLPPLLWKQIQTMTTALSLSATLVKPSQTPALPVTQPVPKMDSSPPVRHRTSLPRLAKIH